MKKFLAMILGAMLVFGFAVSAFAIPAEIPSDTQAVVAKGTTQITLGGELRMRGWYLDNYSGNRRGGDGTPADANSQGWYDTRVRLSLKADVSKNTTGFVHLETNNGVDNTDSKINTVSSDGYVWGNLNTKSNSDLKILEAWILHKGSGLLGIPAGIKVGHMPLALGEKQFLDHTKFGDDAIVFFMEPTKELHIGLLTTKFAEGSVAALTAGSANDINGYVALATYKLNKDNTIGINYTFVDDQTQATFANLQNLGLHANGKVAGLAYNAEVDIQFGDAPDGLDADTDNDKFKGYGVLLGLGYKVDPVNIRVQYAYGSGDNDNTDGKNKAFQTTLGNDVHYTFIYEFTTRGANTAARSTGISNTTYYRLGLDVDIMKDLKASIDGFILRANKVTSGSKKIGSEVDLRLAYKIDRNLTYSITAGYLDTGKWWEDSAGVSPANNKNITQVMHALTLSF